ncbi:diacylglycerol kinase family protein [Candidatus Albibeggiatoa sp. nov. NOAA]|uniref:diacylglycerol kinase family protein n=1 Tax=Candidatus Albibeggiatoa sp. nov. NOAA TaxID=3162724 RepID=UPI00330220CF|nr:diacylglycerol kinase family protein [Thiotrichaceae bacterium]
MMKGRIKSFKHAFVGIYEFIKCGINSKIQLVAGISVCILGFILRFSPEEWIAIFICIGLVLSLEAMNTAIEELANEVTQEKNERIRKVKDMAAGAVLIASIISAIVASIILFV